MGDADDQPLLVGGQVAAGEGEGGAGAPDELGVGQRYNRLEEEEGGCLGIELGVVGGRSASGLCHTYVFVYA